MSPTFVRVTYLDEEDFEYGIHTTKHKTINVNNVLSVQDLGNGISELILLETRPAYSQWVPQDDRAPRGPGGMSTGGGGNVRLLVRCTEEEVLECLWLGSPIGSPEK